MLREEMLDALKNIVEMRKDSIFNLGMVISAGQDKFDIKRIKEMQELLELSLSDLDTIIKHIHRFPEKEKMPEEETISFERTEKSTLMFAKLAKAATLETFS